MVTTTGVAETNLLSVAGSSTDSDFAMLYLNSLLDELEAYRKKQFENSISGTTEKIRSEVLRKEKEAYELRANNEAAISRGESPAKVDKLNAQYECAVLDHDFWLAAQARYKSNLEKVPGRLDIKILERATPAADGAKP
jgi:hypothetical protein